MNDEKKVTKITSRSENFAEWYTDIIKQTHMMMYSNVKGMMIFEPFGYEIWENIMNYLDKKFKDTGHKNVYMPSLIPESLINLEKQHVEGFTPELLWVTKGGNEDLVEKMCIRPTSETLFCGYFKDTVKSYRDLPKLLNQWCNVIRWEKAPNPFEKY